MEWALIPSEARRRAAVSAACLPVVSPSKAMVTASAGTA